MSHFSDFLDVVERDPAAIATFLAIWQPGISAEGPPVRDYIPTWCGRSAGTDPHSRWRQWS